MVNSITHTNAKLVKSLGHTTYDAIYAGDIERSIMWYQAAFGFQITNINSDFAVIEMAPGRIIEINSFNDSRPRKIGFVSKNIKALKRQLIKANVKFESEDEHYLSVKDPEGNIIEVRGTGYGTDYLDATVSLRNSRNTIRVRLEAKDEMNLVARKITDDSEFDQASEELISLCERDGIFTEGDVFIVSKYSTEVDNIYACISITGEYDRELPGSMEYIKIPPHHYSVFPIYYNSIDSLRTHQYKRRVNFMLGFFTRPEGSYYILEHQLEDHIYISIPYNWVKRNEVKHVIETSEISSNKGRQYLDFSYSVLYVSDIKASVKWYFGLFGFQVLEISSKSAVLEVSPGQILCLSMDETAARGVTIIPKDLPSIRQRILDHNIELESDQPPRWFVIRDPDHNKIEFWGAMKDTQFDISDKAIHDTIRFYLDSKKELYFVIRSIADQSEFQAAAETLLKECRDIGVIPQGDAITISKFSDQVDAFYVGVPLARVPIQNLPEGSDYIVIPALEYSVYPIHTTKLEDLRTTELVNRVQHSNKTLNRPDEFYILEYYAGEDYIEAYIPYVWSDTH